MGHHYFIQNRSGNTNLNSINFHLRKQFSCTGRGTNGNYFFLQTTQSLTGDLCLRHPAEGVEIKKGQRFSHPLVAHIFLSSVVEPKAGKWHFVQQNLFIRWTGKSNILIWTLIKLLFKITACKQNLQLETWRYNMVLKISTITCFRRTIAV